MSEHKQSDSLPLYIADAFTKQAFRGNSAAVCLLPFDRDPLADSENLCQANVFPTDAHDVTKQNIAVEMNLSETAFVKLVNEGDTFQTADLFGLQWFTPTCQVPLCGHATLASAAVLFSECQNQNQTLQFETKSGLLKAKKLPGDKIEIDLPAYESNPVIGKFDKLVKAVVGQLPTKEVVLSHSKKLLIRLCDEVTRKELEAITINDAELLSEDVDVVGIIVTLNGSAKDCRDEEGNRYDFISRYFAPWMGISEDPVTGSAHSVLAPFWANILGKTHFYARQCSVRGGELHIELSNGRVLISGHAVVVVKGCITF